MRITHGAIAFGPDCVGPQTLAQVGEFLELWQSKTTCQADRGNLPTIAAALSASRVLKRT